MPPDDHAIEVHVVYLNRVHLDRLMDLAGHMVDAIDEHSRNGHVPHHVRRHRAEVAGALDRLRQALELGPQA